jgi:hypothetical protein
MLMMVPPLGYAKWCVVEERRLVHSWSPYLAASARANSAS